MKNSGRCPKCGSTEVSVIRARVFPNQERIGDRVVVGFAEAAGVTRYGCLRCGYSEEWIDSPEDESRMHKYLAHCD